MVLKKQTSRTNFRSSWDKPHLEDTWNHVRKESCIKKQGNRIKKSWLTRGSEASAEAAERRSCVDWNRLLLRSEQARLWRQWLGPSKGALYSVLQYGLVTLEHTLGNLRSSALQRDLREHRDRKWATELHGWAPPAHTNISVIIVRLHFILYLLQILADFWLKIVTFK